jgi:hypothetical protein
LRSEPCAWWSGLWRCRHVLRSRHRCDHQPGTSAHGYHWRNLYPDFGLHRARLRSRPTNYQPASYR